MHGVELSIDCCWEQQRQNGRNPEDATAVHAAANAGFYRAVTAYCGTARDQSSQRPNEQCPRPLGFAALQLQIVGRQCDVLDRRQR